jgi:hypothetical protein
LVLASVLVLALAALPVAAGDAAKSSNHDMTVEFVSFDAKAKTVTFKTEKGESKTAPVMEGAVASLGTMKAGDKITITCTDNEKGEHLGVAMAKPVMAKAGAAKHG